jgi:hypothetical protein
MIITETITIRGREFIKTYSDAGFYIKKDGTEEVYSEAIDPTFANRTYTETEELIPESKFTAEEALNIIVKGE